MGKQLKTRQRISYNFNSTFGKTWPTIQQTIPFFTKTDTGTDQEDTHYVSI